MLQSPARQPQFVADWFSVHIPSWERHFAVFAGKPNIHALEIGSWEGRSACWLLQNILTDPSSRITCVDAFPTQNEYLDEISKRFCHLPADFCVEECFDANIEAVGGAKKTSKRKGESCRVLRTLPFDSFDLIYIDGSHMASNVLTDAVLSWDLLHVHGLLVFDDYNWSIDRNPIHAPRAAIDAFLSVFAEQYAVLEHGAQVILRKLPNPSRYLL